MAGNDRTRKLLSHALDWEPLLALAESHAVTPLLYASLSTFPELVPAGVADRLRYRALSNTRRNLALTAELIAVLELFQSHDLPALPVKGPVLASKVYGSLALRSFGDLDILIARQDIERASQILTAAGYRLESPMAWTQKQKRLQWNPELAFSGKDGATHIDLHWGLVASFYPFILDPECFWTRTRTVNLGGRTVLTLSPEDELLFLCGHGAKHLWERLGWICDVARLVSVEKELDWNALIAYSRKRDCERLLLVGLCLARDLLGLSLPRDVLRWQQANHPVTGLARGIEEQLFLDRVSPPPALEIYRFIPKLTKSWRRKVRFYLGFLLIPTNAESATLRLPQALFALYYPWRLGRLSLKYGLQPLIRKLRLFLHHKARH